MKSLRTRSQDLFRFNQGEDAFFVDPHGMGVADGVGCMVGKTQRRRGLFPHGFSPSFSGY